MNKTAKIKNGENVISVDCENKKMYFNDKEVIKLSSTYKGGVLTQEPYAAMEEMCNYLIFIDNWFSRVFGDGVFKDGVFEDRSLDSEVSNEEMQKFLDNYFEFYALTYKDKVTNKEHFVIDDGCEWSECGSGYDSIDGWHEIPDYEECNFNEYVVAYGRTYGKKADAIVMKKHSLQFDGYCNE